MTEFDLLRAFQSRAARIAVGASTVRGRGNAGVVAASRRYLRQLDLTLFGQTAKDRFSRNLDATTVALRDSLPREARHWGLARKVLNIFLRDCLYTTYLDEAFGLRVSEPYLELPLDSITAVHLKRAAGRGALPAWPGVKHLLPLVKKRVILLVGALGDERGRAGRSRRGLLDYEFLSPRASSAWAMVTA